MAHNEHRVISPRVMYFGTPVVLISTENPDGTFNLAPMSSAWWLGNGCLLGLDTTSATTQNLRRTGELVLNLADATMVNAVDSLALYTGTPEVPPHKAAKGYEYLADKFGHAGLTAVPSDLVKPARVAECQIALEATVAGIHPFSGPDSGVVVIEASIVRTHAKPDVMVAGSHRYIDPEQWDPLIMKFTHFYGLGTNLRPSRLADGWQIPGGSAPPDELTTSTWELAYDGVTRTEFSNAAHITRWHLLPGATLPDHDHDRTEYLLVRTGIWQTNDGRVMRPGDILTTRRGERHGGVALTDTELWAIVTDPSSADSSRSASGWSSITSSARR